MNDRGNTRTNEFNQNRSANRPAPQQRRAAPVRRR
jgi:hypothetical protein